VTSESATTAETQGAEEPASARTTREIDVVSLRRLLRTLEVVGVVVAAFVGVSSIVKTALDVQAAARKDVREQIAATEGVFMASATRALEIGKLGAEGSGALLQVSFDDVIKRGPPEFTGVPVVGGEAMIREGQLRACNAREFAMQTHLSLAPAAVAPGFLDMLRKQRRQQQRLRQKWTCDSIIETAAVAGAAQQRAAGSLAAPVAPAKAAPAAKTAPAPSPIPVPVPAAKPAPPPKVVVRPASPAPAASNGPLAVAVFGCSSSSRTALDTIFLLDDYAESGGELAGRPIERARARTTLRGPQVNGIVYDGGEQVFAQALQTFLRQYTGRAFPLMRNAGPATRDLELHVCPNISTAASQPPP
jgi:hypothetical protein